MNEFEEFGLKCDLPNAESIQIYVFLLLNMQSVIVSWHLSLGKNSHMVIQLMPLLIVMYASHRYY